MLEYNILSRYNQPKTVYTFTSIFYMIRHIFHTTALFMLMLIAYTSDIFSYFLFEYHSTYFLLAFLIAYYWYHQSHFIMASGTLLLMSESLIMNASCLDGLVLALPFFTFMYLIKHRLYCTTLVPVITFGIALLADIYIVQGLFNGLITPLLYTISTLCGNMVIVLVFSLKLSGGKTRQSLMPFA